MDVERVIRSYLPQIMHMSLATSVGDKPWVCEVHFAYDDELNLYFMSTAARRHSQEIVQNPRIAGNIVTQHFLKQKVRGVYFEGTAKMLVNVDENHPAYRAYSKRFGMGPEILTDAQKPDGHTFYAISVETFYLFDGYESSPSQKYSLAWRR